MEAPANTPTAILAILAVEVGTAVCATCPSQAASSSGGFDGLVWSGPLPACLPA